MPNDEKLALRGNRLMEIGSLTPPHATHDEWRALIRFARIGQWYEEYFALKFMDGNLPTPQTPLYGSRLRVQIDTKEGWEDWHR